MRSEDRARAEEVFHRLAPLAPSARATLLAQISSEDPALGAEIESLLASHDSDGALDRLTAEIAPDSLKSYGPVLVASDPPSGTAFGQYEIVELIGRGGMGDVYRARDTKLGREVALKFLPAWLSRDPAARDRFLVEARVVSSIDHTNVCTLHDLSETADGRLYLIMPYYEGETLKTRLARGPVPVEEALDIALQTAQGLAAAHECGVVHRDIKPANLLLTGAGRVKILDFGVAKLADVALTRTGQTPGTASYMSPEQTAGDVVDARSDLWSLGAVLHEMLIGRRPATEPDRVAAALSAVPRAVAEVVGRLLAFSPEDRYPDALSLAQDLGVLATGGKALDARPAATIQRILADLKRRNVFRVAAVYGAIGFGVIEVATNVFPNIPLPAWAVTLVVWLVLLGFPPALVLAWAFEATPAGVRRTRRVRPAILDAIAAQPATRRWPIGIAGAVGGALVVGAAWVALGGLRSGAASAGEGTGLPAGATGAAAPAVAVLPFRAVGTDLDYLREGMVDLLSLNFDDVQGLRKIDPMSVMSTWNQAVGEGQETDPATAVAVARTLGASYALTGSAVQVGDQGTLSLGASAYDVRSAALLGSTHVEGPIDSLRPLIDRLTIDLLRLRLVPTDSGAAVPNLARVSTLSLPALKAYLAGEREYRKGNWAAASVQFREAVDLDSMFARAHFRLGWAMMAAGRGRPAALPYLTRAASLAAGLPVRDSLLLSFVGISAASESTLRRLTTEYPDDADGWNQMGELLFHAGPVNFWPPAEYRNAFERAIALAPNYVEPYQHLLEDAFARLDSARVRSLLGASSGQPHDCHKLVYDLRWGEDVDRRRALAALDTMPGDAFALTGSCGQTFVAPADAVFEVAERDGLARLRPGSPGFAASVAFGSLAGGHLFRGEVRAARALAALADDNPDLRDRAERNALTLRMSPYSDTSGASAADRLGQRLAGESGVVVRRELWLGLYAMAQSREDELSTALQELDTQAADTASARADDAASVLEVLRTYAALRRGELDRLRDFEAAQRVSVGRWLDDGDFLRYDVGLLLLEAGRLDDARRYFLSQYPESWYYVPARYQLGRTYEALGERDKARDHYRIFVQWWKNADPELQPWVEEGRAGLARTGG